MCVYVLITSSQNSVVLALKISRCVEESPKLVEIHSWHFSLDILCVSEVIKARVLVKLFCKWT